MNREEIVMVCSPDMSGQVRGKSFPARDMAKRLVHGIGWVPTNVQITTFNSISESPFGALGDLLMIPDPSTEVHVDFGDDRPKEYFFLGNIHHTDGTPWECCIRNQLLKALEELKQETGLNLKSAFELEFQFLDDNSGYGPGFSLSGLRNKKEFGEIYLAALRQAGVNPDSFLREWGDQQYEVTMHPQLGVTAADHAVFLRELAKATAHHLGDAITFTPLHSPDSAGNGVHIHMSFVDDNGRPATYDKNGPGGLSAISQQFVAGILHHLPEIVAFTAPSQISYKRLTPHRWSAAYNNLGYRDREASVRICPVADLPGTDIGKQFNFEFRAGDSAANPHLQMAALVYAGLEGIRKKMSVPEPTQEDLSLLNPTQLTERGYIRLPGSLSEALDLLRKSKEVKTWFGELFVDVYLKHKKGEIEFLADKTDEEIYQAYEQVY